MSTRKTGPLPRVPRRRLPTPRHPRWYVPTDAPVTTTVGRDERDVPRRASHPDNAPEVECEGDPSVHRPSRSPRTPPAAERPRAQSALVLARGNARSVPVRRPRGMGRGRLRPGTAARPGTARAAGRAGRGPAVPAPAERRRRRPGRLSDRRPLVPGPERGPARRGGLFLPGVRHHGRTAPVLRRARHPRRRPPQGGQRPRGAADRGRTAVPARLLPADPVPRRLAAGALPGARPQRTAPHPAEGGRRHLCPDLPRAARRPGPARPDLAGPGRQGATAAARLRRGGERPRRTLRHRPALRRRQRAPAAPGDAAGHRRGPRGARVLPAHRAPGAGGVPHQRGARRLPRPGADRRTVRPRAGVRGGAGGGAGRHGVHHAHPRPGRHRPLRTGPGRPALRTGRRAARDRDPADPRARHGDLPGRRAEPVQHGRDGAAAGPARQRGVAAARPGQPGDVRRTLAGIRRRGGADHLRDQRGARAHLGGPGGAAARRPADRHPAGRGRADRRRLRALGRGGGHPGPGRLGAAPHAARTTGAGGTGAAARLLAATRGGQRRAGLDRRRARPGRAHDRLRPARAVVQTAHPDAPRPGPAAGAAAAPGAAGADRGGGQGAPGRRRRQAPRPGAGPVRRRPGGAPPDRLPARLRHGDGAEALPGLRRLAEQPAAPAGGLRHLRDEGGAQRLSEPLGARRLVGRVVPAGLRLGHSDRRRPRHGPGAARRHRGGGPVRPAGAADHPALLRARPRRAAGPLDPDGPPDPHPARPQGAGRPHGPGVRGPALHPGRPLAPRADPGRRAGAGRVEGAGAGGLARGERRPRGDHRDHGHGRTGYDAGPAGPGRPRGADPRRRGGAGGVRAGGHAGPHHRRHRRPAEAGRRPRPGGPPPLRGPPRPRPHRPLRLHGPHPAHPPPAGLRRGTGPGGPAVGRTGGADGGVAALGKPGKSPARRDQPREARAVVPAGRVGGVQPVGGRQGREGQQHGGHHGRQRESAAFAPGQSGERRQGAEGAGETGPGGEVHPDGRADVGAVPVAVGAEAEVRRQQGGRQERQQEDRQRAPGHSSVSPSHSLRRAVPQRRA
ncbi:hypothetical protein SGPA1_11667 [Streptomyces misionensis JCM 4497]